MRAGEPRRPSPERTAAAEHRRPPGVLFRRAAGGRP
jgi:hypothetical protein